MYKIHHYRRKINQYSYFVLGGDIGGTNTNLGVAGIQKNKPVLLFSLHFKTKELPSLISAIKEILKYAEMHHGIKVRKACFGGAGVVNNTKARLTNIKWDIDAKEIVKKTSLSSVFVVNDFQLIGYGVNLLNKKDLYPIQRRAAQTDVKSIIGAGTGLGKGILVYEKDAFIPSEGGHADLPLYDAEELKLAESIKGKRTQPVSYEEVLSGKGIESLYSFFRKKPTKYTREIDKAKDKVQLIAKYRKKDPACRRAFKLYAKLYARCAKNFALDTLPRAGLYIAGGIAAKHPDIFKTKTFLREFNNAKKQRDILKKIPVYVITNYNVSLYGACFAAIKN